MIIKVDFSSAIGNRNLRTIHGPIQAPDFVLKIQSRYLFFGFDIPNSNTFVVSSCHNVIIIVFADLSGKSPKLATIMALMNDLTSFIGFIDYGCPHSSD